MLSSITWILTFGCLIAILLNPLEDYLLHYVTLFMASCRITVFNTQFLLEFYINFEMTLFPILMMILGWGYQPERLSAGIALIIYTIIGSIPFLIYLILLSQRSIETFFQVKRCLLGVPLLQVSFYLTITAFLVKLPIFLFHM